MKVEDKFLKGFEWLVEAFFWLKFVASPVFASFLIGGLVSLAIDGETGHILWGIIVFLGLIAGIALAEYARKQPGGASTYDSKIMATPELDNSNPEKPNK